MNRRQLFFRSVATSVAGLFGVEVSAKVASPRDALPEYLRSADPPFLWLEDAEGSRWDFDRTTDSLEATHSYIYQHARFSNEVTHNVRRAVVKEEVVRCVHPQGAIHSTEGWIDGVEGRECGSCFGSQVRNVGEDWPELWDTSGSRYLYSGGSTWSDDLVTAMVRSGDWTAANAAMVSAVSCERCMNVLFHAYVLDDGYPLHSEEWQKAGTSCELCRDHEVA